MTIRLLRLWGLMALLLSLAPLNAAHADAPPAEEVESVMGARTKVEKIDAGTYNIDGDTVSLDKLVSDILPRRETTLKAMQDSIDQRLAAASAAADGATLDAKRGQCQALPANSIDRTRCYQELVMLREEAGQTVEAASARRQDDLDQKDRLQAEIDAIQKFIDKYGPQTPVSNSLGSMPFQ